MIQALPLTQSQTPANYPNASRQLMPYQVPLQAGSTQAEGLSFQATGATTWLQFADQAKLDAAAEWRAQPDLPLVSLSLPGLLLMSLPTGNQTDNQTGSQLMPQYRFDLPYTDEINAFAQIPQPPQRPEAVSPLPASPPPQPPQPLVRDSYRDYWQRLSNRASLAGADGVLAFDLTISADEQGRRALRSLIEPYDWTVRPDFQLERYPGSLSLQNGSTLELTGDLALQGISAEFSVRDDQLTCLEDATPNSSEPRLAITAGSLTAKPKRRLSPEGRRRIIEATKARWARLRAGAAGKAAAKPRRKIGAAAKKRLSALAKARWAKIKAAGGKSLKTP
jgi:hypothetical protein